MSNIVNLNDFKKKREVESVKEKENSTLFPKSGKESSQFEIKWLNMKPEGFLCEIKNLHSLPPPFPTDPTPPMAA